MRLHEDGTEWTLAESLTLGCSGPEVACWEADPLCPPVVIRGAKSAGEGEPAEDDASELYGEAWVGSIWPGAGCSASSTNRRGGNRQPVDAGGGEDTADWGWLVEWPEGKWEEWREKIGRAQRAAQAGDFEGSLVTIGCVQCLVRPSGARVGGLYFAWVVEACGYRLTIMDRPKAWGETPNVRVHVGALALLQWDLESVHGAARSLVELMGGRIRGEKLSRVDACLDLIDVPVADFVRPFLAGECVRRGRKWGVYGDGLALTGFHVGEGPVRLRIYDKVCECRSDSVKWDAMVALRYGGEVPDVATRVEWQLRRRVLKEFGVSTVADWLEKRAAVLDYLTSKWFRLTSEAVDRENSQRFGPSALWERVCEGFAAWAGLAVLPAVRVRLKRKLLDVASLFRQSVGCIASAMAIRGRSVVRFRDLVEWFEEQASVFEEEIEAAVVGRFREKRLLWDQALEVAA